MSRWKPGGRRRDWAFGIAFAFAAFFVAGGPFLPAWIRIFISLCFSLASAAFLAGGAAPLGKFFRRVGLSLLFPWFNKEETLDDYPQYPGLIKRHRLLLGFTIREIAKRARLSTPTVYCYVVLPFIPRPDYLARLCDALLLPVERLKREVSYGEEYLLRRLARYAELGVEGLPWAKIHSASPEELDDVILAVEDTRLANLRREGRRVP